VQFCVGVVGDGGDGGDANLRFYGGIGGGIDLGSGRNDAVDVVVAVENRSVLSHLQRFIALVLIHP